MLSAKDLGAGCMAIVAVIISVMLIPILFLFFKFSLLAAIPIGLIIGILVSVGLLGKLIRTIFSRKY